MERRNLDVSEDWIPDYLGCSADRLAPVAGGYFCSEQCLFSSRADAIFVLHTCCIANFIAGARQVGKSTLAREIVSRRAIPTSVSLDTRAVLQAARADPDAFVAGLGKPVFIDEVQRVPELLLSIKDDLERKRSNGRYLLTGSANILTLPKVAATVGAAVPTVQPT